MGASTEAFSVYYQPNWNIIMSGCWFTEWPKIFLIWLIVQIRNRQRDLCKSSPKFLCGSLRARQLFHFKGVELVGPHRLISFPFTFKIITLGCCLLTVYSLSYLLVYCFVHLSQSRYLKDQLEIFLNTNGIVLLYGI